MSAPDTGAVYYALRGQGVRGSWTFADKGDHVLVEPVAEMAPRDSGPMVREAAEALELAGYECSRSRTRVRVYAAGKRPKDTTAPDFVTRSGAPSSGRGRKGP